MPERPVRDVIRKEPLLARPDEMVLTVARRMASRRDGCTLVVDGDRLCGIFTEHDLLVRVVAVGLDPAATRIDHVMTSDPDSIAPGAPLKAAIRLMDECGYRHLPVVDGAAIVGALCYRDLPLLEMAAIAPELDERHTIAERLW